MPLLEEIHQIRSKTLSLLLKTDLIQYRCSFYFVEEDIDECVERTGICLNGNCINLVGSFNCLCQPGYRLSSSRDTCIGKTSSYMLFARNEAILCNLAIFASKILL